jgi:hypothetical protein
MISIATYKLIHYLGIFALLAGLSANLGRAALGSADTPAGEGVADPWKKRLGILHGIALFLILLGGFGMLARIGVDHGELFPGWVWMKLGIWVLLGGLIAARRRASWAARGLLLVPVLAWLAAWSAFTKPL